MEYELRSYFHRCHAKLIYAAIYVAGGPAAPGSSPPVSSAPCWSPGGHPGAGSLISGGNHRRADRGAAATITGAIAAAAPDVTL